MKEEPYLRLLSQQGIKDVEKLSVEKLESFLEEVGGIRQKIHV